MMLKIALALAALSTGAHTSEVPQNATPAEQPTVAQVVTPAVAQQNIPCEPAHNAPAASGPETSSSTDTPSVLTEAPAAPLLSGDKEETRICDATDNLNNTNRITQIIAQALAQRRGIGVLHLLDTFERKSPLYRNIVKEKFQFLRDIPELRNEVETPSQPLLPLFLCHPRHDDALVRMLACGMDPNIRADWLGTGKKSFLLDVFCATLIRTTPSFIVTEPFWIFDAVQALLDHGADPRKPSTELVPSERPLLLPIDTPHSDLATSSCPTQKTSSILEQFDLTLLGNGELAKEMMREKPSNPERADLLMRQNAGLSTLFEAVHPAEAGIFCRHFYVLSNVLDMLRTKAKELGTADRHAEKISDACLIPTTTTTAMTVQRVSTRP